MDTLLRNSNARIAGRFESRFETVKLKKPKNNRENQS
jgi:hypothetical protein